MTRPSQLNGDGLKESGTRLIFHCGREMRTRVVRVLFAAQVSQSRVGPEPAWHVLP
jgi:hypothetical protein